MKRNWLVLICMLCIPSSVMALTDPHEAFLSHGRQIRSQLFETLPVHDRGRIKPAHTFMREAILFVTGGYNFSGLDAVQTYLSLIGFSEIERLKVLNVRHVPVRKALGLNASARFFSTADIESSKLLEFAQPLLEKEEKNSRALEPHEKNLLEIYNQYWLLKNIHSGQHLLRAVDANEVGHAAEFHQEPTGEAVQKVRDWLQATIDGNWNLVSELRSLTFEAVRQQHWPELFAKQFEHLEREVQYNKIRPFLIAGLLFLILGASLAFKDHVPFLSKVNFGYLLVLPFFPLAYGLYLRVIITGFAPVTNMYGTMIWVSFGIGLFSLVLWYLYQKHRFVGGLWIAAAATLFLTESIPLVLSPDLDPIVAVLRSNLWLTIHVLTIVISYAAFAIAMILGNIVLIRTLRRPVYDDPAIRDAAKSCYRMIQLGVFLLSGGIILGGVWADYSWGRFWGWDPKETWALIADLGFLAILHAKYVGWLGAYGLLAASTVAFLLVIMAWYGVNFILAAGLHSYGFSSGGATMVLVFVIMQLGLLAASLMRYSRSKVVR
ncbi:MAG: cytochrome c biogenesis protein [Bdellovibrionales bacterium]